MDSDRRYENRSQLEILESNVQIINCKLFSLENIVKEQAEVITKLSEQIKSNKYEIIEEFQMQSITISTLTEELKEIKAKSNEEKTSTEIRQFKEHITLLEKLLLKSIETITMDYCHTDLDYLHKSNLTAYKQQKHYSLDRKFKVSYNPNKEWAIEFVNKQTASGIRFIYNNSLNYIQLSTVGNGSPFEGSGRIPFKNIAIDTTKERCSFFINLKPRSFDIINDCGKKESIHIKEGGPEIPVQNLHLYWPNTSERVIEEIYE